MQITFLPSAIAVVGNVVRIKEGRHDKEWSEGWEILYAGDEMPGKVVEDSLRASLNKPKKKKHRRTK